MDKYQKIIVEGLLEMSGKYADFCGKQQKRHPQSRLKQWIKKLLNRKNRRNEQW